MKKKIISIIIIVLYGGIFTANAQGNKRIEAPTAVKNAGAIIPTTPTATKAEGNKTIAPSASLKNEGGIKHAPQTATNQTDLEALPDTKDFHEDIITPSGNPLGGFIVLDVYRNGNWKVRTNVHNSGAVGFKYQLMVTNLASNGFLFTIDHAGSCDGTDKVFKIRRDDTWETSGNSPAIASNYKDVLNGSLKWTLKQQADILSIFTAFAMPLNPVCVVKLSGSLVVKSNELLFDGTKKLTGIVVNNLGQIVLQVSMITYDLFAYGHIPKYRQLTSEEYNWANKFYNNKLPSINQIVITNLMSVDKRAFTVPNGNGITIMNLGDAFDNPMKFTNQFYTFPGQIFIHELAHVWQIQNSAQLKAFAEGVSNQWKYTILGHDVYAYSCGQPWGNYNYEQQAHIVDVCYQNRNGQLVSADNSCETQYTIDNVRGIPFPQ